MDMKMLVVMALVIGMALMACLLYLQYRLCSMEKHWYGLILPMISLVFCVNGYMTMFGSDRIQVDVAIIYWILPVILMTMMYFYVRFFKKK